jgi:hypothetical protein
VTLLSDPLRRYDDGEWRAKALKPLEPWHLLAGVPYDPDGDWLPVLWLLMSRYTRDSGTLHTFAEARCERLRYVTPHHKPTPVCPQDPERQRWCPACQARELLSNNLPPEGPKSSDTEATS